jgi:hypothetical protein
VTEAPFVNGDSTAPGEIADLRRVGISPDFWYPVTVSDSVWKEASHPGNHPERTTTAHPEVEARGKSPAQKGEGSPSNSSFPWPPPAGGPPHVRVSK